MQMQQQQQQQQQLLQGAFAAMPPPPQQQQGYGMAYAVQAGLHQVAPPAGMYGAPSTSSGGYTTGVAPPSKKVPEWLREMLLKKQVEDAKAGMSFGRYKPWLG